ncbi:MAG: DUF4387 domain-containing protein [Proteobacteria bacterium]|nr:DUF4387 domain-containing protein [Pseudomonadota bacterium]
MTTLKDLASTIRSKNAGVDLITFDIIFRDRDAFVRVRDSAVITPARVADMFRVPPADITDFVVFEPARAIKFTIRRKVPSGSPGERDVFGSQQYPPLFEIRIPD